MLRVLFFLFSIVMSQCLCGQNAGDGRPPLRFTRFSENYSFLADSTKRTERWDALKYIELGGKDDHYLTLGSDVRYLYDLRENSDSPARNRHLLRLMVHADLHLGKQWRFFVQPASNHLFAGNGVERIVDEDRLFLLNAFADVRLAGTSEAEWRMRVGRFELNYGSGRFITVREGPNVRQYWEGLRLRRRTKQWRADFWLTQFGSNRAGVFDNPVLDSPQTFWGSYWSWSGKQNQPTFDAYYLGLRNENRVFFAVGGLEVRHTLGARVANEVNGWDYDVDLTGQAGDTEGQPIRAWGFGSSVGYTYQLRNERVLRAGIKLDAWSGDRDSTDARNNAFNPLYPRQGYYQGAGALFPSNFIDVHPSLTYVPSPQWQLVAELSFYWRTSTQDGIYFGGGGQPGLPPALPAKQYLGRQLGATVTYRPTRNSYLTLLYSHFSAGDFVVQNRTPAEIEHFVNLILCYRI